MISIILSKIMISIILIILKVGELIKIIRHLGKYIKTYIAIKSNQSKKEFIEEMVKQLLRIPLKHYRLVVNGDGTTKIEEIKKKNHNNPIPKESVLDHLNAPGRESAEELDRRKREEVDREIAKRDSEIREKQEELEKIKEELKNACRRELAPEPIREAFWGLFALFIILSIAELWPLIYFIGPWFGVDTDRIRNLLELVHLLPIAIGLFAGLVYLASPIISSERRFTERLLCGTIYFTICFGLAWMRAVQCNDGAFNWGLFMVFAIVVAVIPLVAAYVKSILKYYRNKIIEIYHNNIKKLEDEERELEAEVKKLKREKEKLIKRRESIGMKPIEREKRKRKQEEAEKEREYVFLIKIEAKLVIYRRIYDQLILLLGRGRDYQEKEV